MPALKPPQPAPIPATFLGGLLLAGGFMVFTAWDQAHWWQTKEDYSFGWVVPWFVAYVVYDRWSRITALLQVGPGRIDSPAGEPAWLSKVVQIAGFLALAAGGLLFLIGALYRAAAGPSYAGTSAITLGMAGTVLASIYFLAPTQAVSPAGRAVERRLIASLFLFPVLVWLISAPMITAVENNLRVFLMNWVTTAVFFVFDLLGLSLEQRGNVLVLPTGNVGVAEACSGIRSLTGCLFAGSFLAALFIESWWRKAVLMVASLLLAFVANLLRSIFLTSWAYSHGARSIEGPIHDISGYAVLGLTAVLLVCFLPVLAPKNSKAETNKQKPVSAPLVPPGVKP